MIRNHDAGLEKSRQHLPPACVRFPRLIANRRVAADIDDRYVFDFLYLNSADARAIISKFKRQKFIPSPSLVSFLAVF